MAAGEHAVLKPVTGLLVRHARLLLAAALFVGLALPALAALLRPTLPYAVAGLLFLSMLRVEWPQLVETVRRPRLVIAGVLWILIASPLLMAAAVAVSGVAEGVAAALVLMAGAPPIMSAPAMALLLGLDMGLALVLVGFATLAAPLTLPLVAGGLAGQALAVPLPVFAWRVAALILGSFAAALLVRRLAGEARLARAISAIDAGSVLFLLLFAVAIMDGVAAVAAARPGFVAAMVAGSYIANLGLQAATAAVFAAAGLRRALTVAFAAGNCNMAVVLAALPQDADPDTLLWFALAQFPIYTLPALLSRPYRRMLGVQPGLFSNGASGSKP